MENEKEQNMSTEKQQVLAYMQLELQKLERGLSEEENKQREEILTSLGLTHEQVVERGKDEILS